jgi:hypothetical protein
MNAVEVDCGFSLNKCIFRVANKGVLGFWGFGVLGYEKQRIQKENFG